MIDHPEVDNYDDAHDNDYDRVTARDIADLLHHYAQTRCGTGRDDDPAARAAFLHRKAELFSSIAERAARTRVDAFVEQIRQLATDARTAAAQADLQLPHQRVGPNQRRTPDDPAAIGGANSEENTGASPG